MICIAEIKIQDEEEKKGVSDRSPRRFRALLSRCALVVFFPFSYLGGAIEAGVRGHGVAGAFPYTMTRSSADIPPPPCKEVLHTSSS